MESNARGLGDREMPVEGSRVGTHSPSHGRTGESILLLLMEATGFSMKSNEREKSKRDLETWFSGEKHCRVEFRSTVEFIPHAKLNMIKQPIALILYYGMEIA